MTTTPAPQIRTYFPWGDHTDGQWHPATHGVHFDCPPANFAIRCRRWGRNHGWHAQAKVNGRSVTFRFTDPRSAAAVTTTPGPGPDSPKSRPDSTIRVLARAAQRIRDYAEQNYPAGEFKEGLLRAAVLIGPIPDLPDIAE